MTRSPNSPSWSSPAGRGGTAANSRPWPPRCSWRAFGLVRAHRAASVVAGHPRRLSGRRMGAGRLRREARHPRAAGTALHRRDSARVRDLGRAGRRARPTRPAAAASARYRHRAAWRCRGGRTAAGAPRSAWSGPWPPGPTSPGRSDWQAQRSCPPRSTCGDGGHGSAWHGARPSPTSWPGFPLSSPGWAPSVAPSASTRPPMTWPTGSSCECLTATRTPTRSRGRDHRSPR